MFTKTFCPCNYFCPLFAPFPHSKILVFLLHKNKKVTTQSTNKVNYCNTLRCNELELIKLNWKLNLIWTSLIRSVLYLLAYSRMFITVRTESNRMHFATWNILILAQGCVFTLHITALVLATNINFKALQQASKSVKYYSHSAVLNDTVLRYSNCASIYCTFK